MAAWAWDADTRTMWASENADQILAHGVPTSVVDVFSGAPPETRALRLREIEALLTEQPGEYRAEFMVEAARAGGAASRSDSGTAFGTGDRAETGLGRQGLRWLETRATAEADSNGVVRRVLGVTSDITARKRAELAWRRAKPA
jgi:PAS domain-containing protein